MIDLLKVRIEQNYEDFKAETLAALTKEGVFELAGHISAIEDVRFFMSTHDWLDETDADYLLTFHNPLAMLADRWEIMLHDSGISFRKALAPLFGRNDYDPDEDDFDTDMDDYDHDMDDYDDYD